MAPRPTLGDRLYRLLLRLFPAEFRGDFAADMTVDFRDERADARAQGLRAVIRLWCRTVPGLVLTAARAWLDDLLHDARYALRSMRRAPGFAAAAVVMLALSTGANAAMFSVIDAVLLHSPFRDSDRLVIVHELSGRQETSAIPPTHIERIGALPFFSAGGALWAGTAVLTGAGEPHHQSFECVTAGVFDALGTPARLGRVFTRDDDRPGSDPVIVLSHGLWKESFGGDPSVIGHVVYLNGTAATIVGVMPARFLGPFTRNSTDMWAPLGPALHGVSPIGCTSPRTVNMFARLKAGVSVPAAVAQAAASRAVADLPDEKGSLGATLALTRLDDQTFGELRAPLLALVGAVVCVLLIACANVANLQLERILGRRHEIGLRLALGASRGRIVRQTLTENLVLSAIGAAAGLATAWLTLPFIVSLIPAYVPHIEEIGLRTDVLIGTVAAVLLVGLFVGLLPAVQATSRHVMDDLRTGAKSVTGAGQWPRRALVVVELALATTLLVGAVLTVQTFLTLRPTSPGFNSVGKVIATVRLGGPFVAKEENAVFFEKVIERLQRVPGVEAVSGTTYLPMSGSVNTANATVGDSNKRVWLSSMTETYLRDLQIPIVQGRAFRAADDSHAPAVAIVNDRAARTFWPGSSALGQPLTTVEFDGRQTTRQVIGVARNTRSLGGTLQVQVEVYVPYAQDPIPLLHVIMTTGRRTYGNLLRALRDAVAVERPDLIVDRLSSFEDLVDRSVATSRFGAWLFGAFGALAMGLAGLGLTAVVAWWVTQRTREIGIRMALGASGGAVARLILRQGIVLAATGVLLGMGLAAASMKLLEGWLYGVTPLDVRTFILGAAAMLSVAGLASYLPARRAARIDPIVTLKGD